MTQPTSPFSALFAEIEALIDQVAVADCPAVIGDLERVKARLWLRLNTSQQAPPMPSPADTSERLLTVQEAAAMLGVRPRWLYDHAHEIPAKVELPGRQTRFSKRKLERWIAQRTALTSSSTRA